MIVSIDGILHPLTKYGIERMKDSPESSTVPAYV